MFTDFQWHRAIIISAYICQSASAQAKMIAPKLVLNSSKFPKFKQWL